jgi:ABC-type Zn uptake system ZnuABC Zn-binding protein ZnuA
MDHRLAFARLATTLKRKEKLFMKLFFTTVIALLCAAQIHAADKVRVVATLTDLADFTRQIGGDHVDVFSLATGIEDTHGVPMKPSFVPVLNKADLLV